MAENHLLRKLHGSIFYSLQPDLLPIEVLHCGQREFRVFLRKKKLENIKIFRSCCKSDAGDAETIFSPIIDSSSLYASGVTRGQGAVLRRIGGRGYLRSRDVRWRSHHSIYHGRKILLYANSTAVAGVIVD